jgi:hypothetical protein
MTTSRNPWAWTPPPLPTTLCARIATIVLGLVTALQRNNVPGGIPYATIMLISMRISAVGREIRTLIEAIQAGTLRTRRSPAPGLTRTRHAAAEPEAAERLTLPRRFGWLLAVPCQAACFGEGVRQLLAEPEMLALMAASPRLVRRLRSLCWMLAVEMPKMPEVATDAAHGCRPSGSAPKPAMPNRADLRDELRDDGSTFAGTGAASQKLA